MSLSCWLTTAAIDEPDSGKQPTSASLLVRARQANSGQKGAEDPLMTDGTPKQTIEEATLTTLIQNDPHTRRI